MVALIPFFYYSSTLLPFFSFACRFSFLLGGWAGVSIPLVYMFLDSKALYVICFYST